MESSVRLNIDEIMLEGILSIPDNSTGLVLFAHGSGSSRFSPRNNFVATELQRNKIGTLLIDLLSEDEDLNYETRFDIELLSRRLISISEWLLKNNETRKLDVGLFGASTGAAAALVASANLGSSIKAVVSRGGRPDLAGKFLPKVIAPTLLIVGGNDFTVIELNESAYKKLGSSVKKLEIIEGATHLFEEHGALERVSKLASEWFKKYLNL